jgi:hypothetical protein
MNGFAWERAEENALRELYYQSHPYVAGIGHCGPVTNPQGLTWVEMARMMNERVGAQGWGRRNYNPGDMHHQIMNRRDVYAPPSTLKPAWGRNGLMPPGGPAYDPRIFHPRF